MQRSLLVMLTVLLLAMVSSCPRGSGDGGGSDEPGESAAANGSGSVTATGQPDGRVPDNGKGSGAASEAGSTELVVRNLFEQRALLEDELETLAATPELAPGRIAELEAELAALDDQIKQLAQEDREAVLSELQVLADANSAIASDWQQLASGAEAAPAAEPGGQVLALLGDPYDGPALPIEELRDQLDEVWVVEFSTTFGDFSMEVYPELAPIHAVRFLELVDGGYYDNMHIHRIAPEWVVQWGDLYDRSDAASLRPNQEPPVYPRYEERRSMVVDLKDEPARFPATEWTICFAKGGPNTASTQPFINLGDNSRLSDMSQKTYFTPFAYVTEGRESIERLVESFKPVMESARADLRAQLEADGAPEDLIQEYLLNDLAWARYVSKYWDPFRMALITEARIVKRPDGQ